MAEFDTADRLLEAARAARAAGYEHTEAYTPFAVEGLTEALGRPFDPVPAITLAAAVAGGAGGYFLQWYSAVIDYPLDVGGRPLHAWPMFVPVAFELAVLSAAVCATLAVLVADGLPRLHHPVFDAPDFDLSTRDRFFLCVRADDPAFVREHVDELFARFDPLRCVEVPR